MIDIHNKNAVIFRNVKFEYTSSSGVSFHIEISLQIKSHEVCCILGSSGSGKTSVLKLITGLLTPKSGHIYVDDELVSANDKIIKEAGSRNVCFVFQSPSLLPHKTVIDNVLFAMRDNRQNIAMAKEFLSQVDMLWYGSKYPHELSMGQKQRVSLARAFASGADIMLLDEPFANLDVENSAQIREYLSLLMRRYKRTIILVTHDAHETMLLADTVYVIDKGRIAQHGTVQELYQSPNNLFVAGFFGALNIIRTYTDNEGNVILPFIGHLRSQFKNCNVIIGIRYKDITPANVDDVDCATVTIKHIKFFGTHNLVRVAFCNGDILDMYSETNDTRIRADHFIRVKINWDNAVIFDATLNEALP